MTVMMINLLALDIYIAVSLLIFIFSLLYYACSEDRYYFLIYY